MSKATNKLNGENDSKNSQQKIWRYLDIGKFLSLLIEEKLYFARPDKFGDLFEGFKPISHAEAEASLIEKVFEDALGKDTVDTVLRKNLPNLFSLIHRTCTQESRLRFGVCCWHKNEYESEAMWKLYPKDSVAIVTTIENLRLSLPQDKGIIVDDVRYNNFCTDPIEKGYAHYGLFQKRKSFEYENEVRALVLLKNNNGEERVSCNLKELIGAIYISPYAGSYLQECVKFILEAKAMSRDLIHFSELINKPCAQFYKSQ